MGLQFDVSSAFTLFAITKKLFFFENSILFYRKEIKCLLRKTKENSIKIVNLILLHLFPLIFLLNLVQVISLIKIKLIFKQKRKIGKFIRNIILNKYVQRIFYWKIWPINSPIPLRRNISFADIFVDRVMTPKDLIYFKTSTLMRIRRRDKEKIKVIYYQISFTCVLKEVDMTLKKMEQFSNQLFFMCFESTCVKAG